MVELPQETLDRLARIWLAFSTCAGFSFCTAGSSDVPLLCFQNFPQDNQKVRLSVNGFLCAFEIPVPGSPTSLSSPTLTGEAAQCNFDAC